MGSLPKFIISESDKYQVARKTANYLREKRSKVSGEGGFSYRQAAFLKAH